MTTVFGHRLVIEAWSGGEEEKDPHLTAQMITLDKVGGGVL
jgi:hypothetical protein